MRRLGSVRDPPASPRRGMRGYPVEGASFQNRPGPSRLGVVLLAHVNCLDMLRLAAVQVTDRLLKGEDAGGVGHWHACSVPKQLQKGMGAPIVLRPGIRALASNHASSHGAGFTRWAACVVGHASPSTGGARRRRPAFAVAAHVPPSNSQNMYCEHGRPLKTVVTPDASPASGGGGGTYSEEPPSHLHVSPHPVQAKTVRARETRMWAGMLAGMIHHPQSQHHPLRRSATVL
jgi:hypothetical protein